MSKKVRLKGGEVIHVHRVRPHESALGLTVLERDDVGLVRIVRTEEIEAVEEE